MNFRYFCLVCVCCFLGQASWSQKDSLRNVLRLAQAPDTQLVWANRDMAYYLMPDSPLQAMDFANRGIELAKKIQFGRGEERCHRMLGMAQEYDNNLQGALQTYAKAVKIAKENQDEIAVGNLFTIQGVACYYQGDFGKAAEYYNHALYYWDSLNYQLGQAHALNNLGIVYRQTHKYQEAEAIYRRALTLKEEIHDTVSMAATLHNLGLCLSFTNQDSASIETFKRASYFYEVLGDSLELASVKVGLGQALMNVGRKQEGVQLLTTYLPQIKNDRLQEYASAVVYLGAYARESENFEQALEYLQQAYEVFEPSDKLDQKKTIELELALTYDALVNPAASSVHWKNYAQISDTLNSAKRQRLLEEMQAKYESKEKENTIKIQELEITQSDEDRTKLIGGFVLTGTLLLIALGLVVANVRSYRKLKAQKELIEDALHEKEVLLKEVHHRVKNNLQIISSLLSLQSRDIQDQAAKEAVAVSKDRVKAMALIHQSLYKQESLRNINALSYIQSLCESIFNSYKVDQDHIQLQLDIDPLELDVDSTIPLGLILNELITNALKYAYPDQTNGTLLITLKLLENNQLHLQVKDNGIGFKVKEKSDLNSFGLKLIEAFAKKLDATWDIQADQGAEVNLYAKKVRVHVL